MRASGLDRERGIERDGEWEDEERERAGERDKEREG